MHRFLLLAILLGNGFQAARPAAIPNKGSASSTKEPQIRRILEKMDKSQLVDLVITIATQANRNCKYIDGEKNGVSPTSVTTLETEIDNSAPGNNANLEIASLVEELLDRTTAGIEPFTESPGKATAGTPSLTGQSVHGSEKITGESAGTEEKSRSVESPSDEGAPSEDKGVALEEKSTFKVQLNINTHPLCVERPYQPNVSSLASIRTQKDVVEYLIYRLCLPSVTAEDLKAIATIIRQMVSITKGMLSPTEKPTKLENLDQAVPTTSAPSPEAAPPPNIDEGDNNAENGPNSSINPTTRVPKLLTDSNAETSTSPSQAARAPITITSREQPFTASQKRSDVEVLRALQDFLAFEYGKN